MALLWQFVISTKTAIKCTLTPLKHGRDAGPITDLVHLVLTFQTGLALVKMVPNEIGIWVKPLRINGVVVVVAFSSTKLLLRLGEGIWKHEPLWRWRLLLQFNLECRFEIALLRMPPEKPLLLRWSRRSFKRESLRCDKLLRMLHK